MGASGRVLGARVGARTLPACLLSLASICTWQGAAPRNLPAEHKKKGGKFQPFKKLFGKRRKKDTSASSSLPREASGKSSCPPGVSNGTCSSDEESGTDSVRSFSYSMSTRAFSHDSIFIPDGGAESEQTFQAMSQDNILGKVKTLQHQLGKNIKFGQRPANVLPVKKASSEEASSEEGPLGPKPMDTVARQDTVSLDTDSKAAPTPGSPGPQDPPGAGREMEEKVAPVKPSRPKRHLSSAGTIESVNLDAIPLAIACLDNSAAKHKLAVKPKNQRISRKHRRLAEDIPHEQGGLESPPPQHQNGHLGGEQLPWPQEEAEPQGSEEEKRHQEDYWRELEAKCRRQKAEAAEKRRLEEQRLQALERRLREEEEEEARVQEEGGDLGGERSRHLQEEAWKLEQLRQREELEAQRRQETERLRLQEEEARRLEQLRQEEELEIQRRQEAERLQEEEARRLEQLRQEEELEAQRRQEAERLRLQEEEARRLEQLRQEEELETQRRQEAERLQQEEARRLEQLRQEEKLEAQRRQEAERLQQEEARRLEQLRQEEELEAQRRQEAERLQQEEARRLEQLRQEEELEAQRRQEAERLQKEEARRLEQLRQEEELETQRRLEAGREPEKAAVRPEEVSPFQPEDSGDSGNAHRGGVEEKLGDPENLEPRRLSSEEPEFTDDQPGQSGHLRIQEGHEAEGVVGHQEEEEEAVAPEKGRRVEELRWQEVDERQSMPRPYTFQVSSGGKQILFPKVNLSPVTPARDAPPAPRMLPAALSVPHTAILVTGAQLCGPAVNLSQIKDTACKSLLGLSEVKRHGDGAPTAATANPAGPPRAPSCSKTRPAPEEHAGSGAALAEWATIRSRILRAAEGDREAARPRDEPPQGSLRRPAPPGAKFSIKPAWQKFSSGDGHKPGAEPEGVRRMSAPGPREETAAATALPEPRGSTEKPEPVDATEGCKFAKDLPSFLVPSPPRPAQRAVAAQAELAAAWDSEAAHPAGEDQASPFGIKLRRTNYSLRFHCEQQAEQKKKKRRSSAGDGAEAQGATGPSAAALVPDKAATRMKPVQAAPSPSQATPDPDKAASRMRPVQAAPSPSPAAPDPDKATTRVKPAQAVPSPSPVAPEPDKAATRMKPVQKPALAPKPAASQTPPPSPPRSKLSRPYLAELLGRRTGKPETEPRESVRESSRDPRPLPPPLEAPKREEEVNEVAERSPASPTAVQKLTQTPEAGRREKPALEDRPSLEKGEAAQPLWVTLALQKQRGFREQQATREERKQAREAKQAAKLTREHVSGSPQSSSRGGSLHAATAENKPETAVARPERREPLRKASTLPTSVTVEISDSVAPVPLLKEVAKRFSTPDATPVATEPAWLALAKRKAKAWSDCPQIIK